VDKKEIANEINKLTAELVDINRLHAIELIELESEFYKQINELLNWVQKITAETANLDDSKLAAMCKKYLTYIGKIIKELNDTATKLTKLAKDINES
jgi:septal ring factor EnvC (AmiA/AmiB activator)